MLHRVLDSASFSNAAPVLVALLEPVATFHLLEFEP
jgi:hypothetical protein